jgi:TRAP-type uncharacterized transport system substrate-binding protein
LVKNNTRPNPRRTTIPAIVVVFVISLRLWSGSVFAADPRMDATNKGVVELETGGSSGISVRMAEDLASLVDDGATRRVLPVVGRTALQNVWDLVLLRGIDMAILQQDVVDSARQKRSLPGLDNGFTYIAKLYDEEFHLLAGPDVKTIADLAHRKVNFGLAGSGSSVTAERVFDLLKVPVQPVNDRPELGLEKLRGGEISAVALVAGKPSPLLQGLPKDQGWHFIAIPVEEAVIKTYVPTILNAQDYPGLVPAGQQVDTIAVGSMLAAARLQPGSDRYHNVSNFVDIFFTQFRSLLEPGHHPKWQEMNLAAEVPGLNRFPPAQQWLDRNVVVAKQSAPDVKTLFSKFLDTRQQALGGAAPVPDQQKQELFNQFQLWQSQQSR